jgi:hypothetical protein
MELVNCRVVWFEGVDWIHLAQDKDHWRAVVNTGFCLMALVSVK